jgi:hypothetical protein
MRYLAIALLLLGLGAVGYEQAGDTRPGETMSAEDGTGWPPPKP